MQALNGKIVLNDVTLTGSAEWIAGSDDETGSCTYKATGVANRLDLAFSSGTRSEIRSNTSGAPSGNWIGTDGVSHPMQYHNLLTDPGWFPSFVLGNLLSSSNIVLTYIGQENRNGASVLHLTATAQPVTNLAANTSAMLQHLSQVDIYLDPSTNLPVSYMFSSHPDSNAMFDIPTEIRYSNYQSVSGLQIPFHIQKYINNTLALDLQIQNASLNTGVTIAQ